MSKIPVVYITDIGFMFQTGVAAYSLYASKAPDTEYDLYLILVDDAYEKRDFFKPLTKIFKDIHILKGSTEKYSKINQLAHISRAGLVKFDMSDMIPEYDKILYVDGDIIIRSDLSDLYNTDLGDNIMGAVKSLDMVFDDNPMINSGVMLINAKRFREEKYAEKMYEKRVELGDRRSMDQETINIVLKNKILYLPAKYNCIPEKLVGIERKNYEISKLNEVYSTSYSSKEGMIDDAVLIHYATGGKPWKYTYVQCGEEWYGIYKKSPFSYVKIRRLNKFQAHLKGFFRRLRKKGIKDVIKRAGELISLKIKGVKYQVWG